MAKKEEVDLSKLVTDMSLPSRQPDAKPPLKPASTLKVRTNCYKIDLVDKNIDFHRYELRFTVVNPRASKDLSENVKNEVNAENRRELLNHLFENVRKAHTEIFDERERFLFDCGCTLISRTPLNIDNEPINIEPDSLSSEFRDYLPRQIDHLYGQLKYIGEIKLDSASLKRADELDARDVSPIQILSLIFNQQTIRSKKFHVFPQKSFLKNRGDGGDFPKIQGRLIKDGLSKGIRLCGNDAVNPDLMLQVDVRKGAFFPEDTLADYLIKFLNLKESRDLERHLETCLQRADEMKKLEKELKGLTLITTHLRKNKIFRCDGLDSKSARDREFEKDKENRGEEGPAEKRARLRISIVNYYHEVYKHRTRYDRCPCIIQKIIHRETKQKVDNYYPFDVLKIVGGQRVSLQKMDGVFQEQMIKTSCMNNHQLQESSDRLMEAAFLRAGNPDAKAYKCPVDSEPMIINADVLHPPAWKFAANQTVQIDPNSRPRLQNQHKFLMNGACKDWLAVNYNRCVEDRIIKKFVDEFIKFLAARNTRIPQPKYLDARNEREIFSSAEQNRITFILFITGDRDGDYLHNVMKHYEMKSGIITQHIRERTAKKQAERLQQVTFENIVLKANEKMGGTNLKIATGQSFIRANQPVIRAAATQYLENATGNNRLFIGIDMSNTSSQDSKTVVAIAYTYNEELSPTGFYFFLPPQNTIIEGLGPRLEKPIRAYKERSKRKAWPSHLIIYRGGVSEGDYLRVIEGERGSIKAYLAEFCKKERCPPMGFTIITAQRQHKFRLVPAGPSAGSSSSGPSGSQQQQRGPPQRGPPQQSSGGANQKNDCPPGTFVAKDIVDPTKEQFILMAHKAFQGIPKPVVYTVVADESPKKTRIARDELANLTNGLCYLHGAVLQPVSLPGPLYYAKELAKRGNNNHQTALAKDGISPEIGPDELSKLLQVRSEIKFWS